MLNREHSQSVALPRMVKLAPSSLDWALTHVERYGDTYIFPTAFEFEAIRHAWDGDLRAWLSNQDMGQWAARPHRSTLAPKGRFSFRLGTQLDPLDTLVIAALIFEIGNDLEASRQPPEDEIVHSFRFSPETDGQLFDPKFSFESFRQRSAQLNPAADWVVVADIADFFPRLYFHPLENALASATSRSAHVNAITKLIKSWNFSVSYGIPVGPIPVRLLAEVAIADVDAALRSEELEFCRWVDDYRIFCDSERAAHEALALLATVLSENHGLTLQPQKTEIMSSDDFARRYLSTEKAQERAALSDSFEEILGALGLDDPYSDIDYDALDDDKKALVDGMNLVGLLEAQILGPSHEPDPVITRFVLRRLTQLDDESALDLVIDNMERLYPMFEQALMYLRKIGDSDPTGREALGGRMLDLIDTSVVGHLEYHRDWILDAFASQSGWGNVERLTPIYSSYDDTLTRRSAILALGRAKQAHWFKTRKRNLHSYGPWERRAFIAAASCLPGDEAKHWYRSIAPQLDRLDKAVVGWARAKPF